MSRQYPRTHEQLLRFGPRKKLQNAGRERAKRFWKLLSRGCLKSCFIMASVKVLISRNKRAMEFICMIRLGIYKSNGIFLAVTS